jgi:hypothetical protein
MTRPAAVPFDGAPPPFATDPGRAARSPVSCYRPVTIRAPAADEAVEVTVRAIDPVAGKVLGG